MAGGMRGSTGCRRGALGSTVEGRGRGKGRRYGVRGGETVSEVRVECV